MEDMWNSIENPPILLQFLFIEKSQTPQLHILTNSSITLIFN